MCVYIYIYPEIQRGQAIVTNSMLSYHQYYALWCQWKERMLFCLTANYALCYLRKVLYRISITSLALTALTITTNWLVVGMVYSGTISKIMTGTYLGQYALTNALQCCRTKKLDQLTPSVMLSWSWANQSLPHPINAEHQTRKHKL